MAGSGRLLGQRGISAVGAPSEWGTLHGLPHSASSGSDTTPSASETYIAEVYVGNVCEVTGFSLLNGSAAAGNVTVALHDASGAVITKSASTAQSGTNALQAIPFAAVTTLVGPAVHYVSVQFSSTSARFRTHPIGVSGASKATGTTYGTVTAITPPTAFTANLAPLGSLY